jgi:iron complex outermembrane receptor protein
MASTFRRHLLASTLIAGAAVAASPAWAQVTQPAEASPDAAVEETKPNEDVIVTGTRIGRPDLTTASPVNIIGQQEIQLRQPSTAEELLRDLPSVRPNLGPAVNNGSDGSSSVDLRGIGTNRTLVLLDGRRIVPFGLDNVVDLNTIPLPLVDRVDVVTGGASSVYGADAVAGVVNFVTKRDFSGVQVDGQYGIAERGDNARFRSSILIGVNTADGNGNAVLGAFYTKTDPLLVTSRSIGAFPVSSTTGLFNGSTAAVPTIFTSPGTGATAFNFPGAIGAVINPATGTFVGATAANTYNTNIGTYFQTPLEKYGFYAAAHYEVTPGVEIYSNALFNRNKVSLQLASSATFTNTYQLSINNPYLPAGARAQLCNAYRGDIDPTTAGTQLLTPAACATAAAVRGGPGTPGYVEIPVIAQRRFTEFGPRGNPIESTQFQINLGVRGTIVDNLKYDLSAQYGETTQNQDRENWGSFTRVQQALRAYTNAAGAPTCTDTSNGCVPLNLFGQEGTITPAQLAFIDLDARIRRNTQLTVVTGNVGGDLFGFKSPFAETPIGFSIGGEYRKLRSASFPDFPSQIQGEVLGTGARTPPDVGEYNVKEAFGELIVPLISDVPFIYRLQAEGGIRYSDYSTTGTSTTWKAGGSWEFFQGFKFRGMYQKAVRSPNILELYQSPVQGLGNLTVDPCQLALPVGNAALSALCVSTGAPQGSIGSISPPSSTQINVTTSGNAALDVERATTYTLGGVISPSILPGFSATFDYYNIRVADAISTPAQSDILNGCYSPALNPGFAYNSFCQLVQRNPLNGSLNGAGDTQGVILAGSNLGIIHTAGFDIGVNQRVPLDDLLSTSNAGVLSLGFNATRLSYYHFQATPNSINRDCTTYYSAGGCTNPRPKWKWNARATYSLGGLDASILWTHISRVSLEPFLAAAITPLSTPQPGGVNPTTVLAPFRSIPAFDYFDLSLQQAIGDNLQLTLTVDNLFDKKPPLVGSGVGGTAFNNGNTFPTVYDPVGRYFTIGARLKF